MEYQAEHNVDVTAWAIDVKAKAIYERLVLNPGPCRCVPVVTMPSAPTPPPLTLQLRPFFSPELAPKFFDQHDPTSNQGESHSFLSQSLHSFLSQSQLPCDSSFSKRFLFSYVRKRKRQLLVLIQFRRTMVTVLFFVLFWGG